MTLSKIFGSFAFKFTEFHLHIACQNTVVAFFESAYNGCCYVSTYCDTDKRRTAQWTKVSHKCKLHRQLCFLDYEVRWRPTRCSRDVAKDSDLHTMIINIEQNTIKSLIIECKLRPNCSERSCVRLVRSTTQPGCVLITMQFNYISGALPTVRTRGITRSLIERFLDEGW